MELADVQQIADEQQKTLDFQAKRITTTATATSNRSPEKLGWSRAMKSCISTVNTKVFKKTIFEKGIDKQTIYDYIMN